MESRRLHLGCFDQVLPGWVNTDITPHIWISRIPGLPHLLFRLGVLPRARYEQHRQGVFRAVRRLDVTSPFPYPNDAFEYVYSSHLLEHLPREKARFCISEIHRVLMTGGVARLAVPDLDRVVAGYDPSDADSFLDALFEADQKRDKNRHHWHYNATSLIRLLEGAGFARAHRCAFRDGKCPDLEQLETRPDSLIVEAVK